MGLAASYRTKFLKRELIRRNMIRRGDMIIGKYKSQSTGKIKYKVSLVLDWVPFRGAIQERKLYVFDLDNLYPQVLKRLIKKVGGLEFTNTGEFTYMRVKMGEGIRDGSITFNKYIRDFIQEVEGVWKTYTLKNYKEINLVDFTKCLYASFSISSISILRCLYTNNAVRLRVALFEDDINP